jgi:RimJ/RimL family protein N-acetyltransferase
MFARNRVRDPPRDCVDMYGMMELATDRLRLRRPTAADAPRLHALLERNGTATDLETLARDLEATEREERQTYNVYLGDELVGSAGLDPRDEPFVWSLWWYLDTDHDDLALELAGALARHGLRELGALRIELYCHPDNGGAREVARRLGFRRDGRVRLATGGPLLERLALGGSPAERARACSTWAPLGRYLAERLDVTAAADTSMEIDWRNDRGAVTVVVSVDSACDRPWLVVSARVCDGDLIEPAAALAHNATLALGALVLVDDRYVLRHTAPLDTASGWSLRQCIELVGNEAIRLAVPPPRPPAGGAVDNYAD